MARYFTPEEVVGLRPKLVQMLDDARHIAGVPFVITSGFRTTAQNAAIPGAAKDSSHPRGWAADLAAGDARTRFKIMLACLHVGFTRIGFYAKDGHLHVDADPSLPPDVCWVEP